MDSNTFAAPQQSLTNTRTVSDPMDSLDATTPLTPQSAPTPIQAPQQASQAPFGQAPSQPAFTYQNPPASAPLQPAQSQFVGQPSSQTQQQSATQPMPNSLVQPGVNPPPPIQFPPQMQQLPGQNDPSIK